jgi:hypothetical protein
MLRKAWIIAVLAITVAVALPGLAKNDEAYIAATNRVIDTIVQIAIERIQNADTYEEMLFWAQWADFHVQLVLARLERKIGPVEYEMFYVTVYNEKVGRSVTFDPIHVIGSGG